MPLSKRAKIIASSIFIITLVAFSTAFLVSSLLYPNPANDNSVRLQLLDNAGVMIEAEGLRIYIDPYNLPPNFRFYPADAILITHPHFDHYQSTTIDLLQKTGTMNIFPANMSTEIIRHGGIGVVPEDQLQVGSIAITAFYMYIPSLYGVQGNHPQEANWTSFIIDINGFTIFHAGDAYNIEEYEELTGLIDVAIMPYYTLLAAEDLVEAVQIIEPNYLILMHYNLGMNDEFIETYGSEITECEIIDITYFESYTFSTV